jgi:hypothetical protein
MPEKNAKKGRNSFHAASPLGYILITSICYFSLIVLYRILTGLSEYVPLSFLRILSSHSESIGRGY